MELDRTTSEPLSRLIGEKLSAVVFVLDYLQLQFDGPILSLYTPVRGHSRQAGTLSKAQPGWRDELCERISQNVRTVQFANDELMVEFADGTSIRASLRPEDCPGPEAGTFVDGQLIGGILTSSGFCRARTDRRQFVDARQLSRVIRRVRSTMAWRIKLPLWPETSDWELAPVFQANRRIHHWSGLASLSWSSST